MEYNIRKSYECSGNGLGIPDHPEKLKERCEINRVSFGEDKGKALQLRIINFQKIKTTRGGNNAINTIFKITIPGL